MWSGTTREVSTMGTMESLDGKSASTISSSGTTREVSTMGTPISIYREIGGSQKCRERPEKSVRWERLLRILSLTALTVGNDQRSQYDGNFSF